MRHVGVMVIAIGVLVVSIGGVRQGSAFLEEKDVGVLTLAIGLYRWFEEVLSSDGKNLRANEYASISVDNGDGGSIMLRPFFPIVKLVFLHNRTVWNTIEGIVRNAQCGRQLTTNKMRNDIGIVRKTERSAHHATHAACVAKTIASIEKEIGVYFEKVRKKIIPYIDNATLHVCQNGLFFDIPKKYEQYCLNKVRKVRIIPGKGVSVSMRERTREESKELAQRINAAYTALFIAHTCASDILEHDGAAVSSAPLPVSHREQMRKKLHWVGLKIDELERKKERLSKLEKEIRDTNSATTNAYEQVLFIKVDDLRNEIYVEGTMLCFDAEMKKKWLISVIITPSVNDRVNMAQKFALQVSSGFDVMLSKLRNNSGNTARKCKEDARNGKEELRKIIHEFHGLRNELAKNPSVEKQQAFHQSLQDVQAMINKMLKNYKQLKIRCEPFM
jgi:hypothetical protein